MTIEQFSVQGWHRMSQHTFAAAVILFFVTALLEESLISFCFCNPAYICVIISLLWQNTALRGTSVGKSRVCFQGEPVDDKAAGHVYPEEDKLCSIGFCQSSVTMCMFG